MYQKNIHFYFNIFPIIWVSSFKYVYEALQKSKFTSESALLLFPIPCICMACTLLQFESQRAGRTTNTMKFMANTFSGSLWTFGHRYIKMIAISFQIWLFIRQTGEPRIIVGCASWHFSLKGKRSNNCLTWTAISVSIFYISFSCSVTQSLGCGNECYRPASGTILWTGFLVIQNPSASEASN